MGFLKSLMIRIGADASGVDKELKRASKEITKTGKEIEKVGAGLTKAVTLPIIAVGAAAVKMGLDAAETEGKFSYSFGAMAESVRSWSDALSKSTGMDAFDFRSTAADMNTLAKGFGFVDTQAADMAKGLAEAAYAMASIYHVDAATMADDIQQAFKGRTTALKDYGIVIDDTTTKTWAYTHGIAKLGDELTATQQAQAIYGQIMAGAADEMSTFESKGEDLATTIQNKINTALKDFGTELIQTGTFDRLVDALTRVLDKADELAKGFSELPTGVQDFIVSAGLGVAALGPLISGIGSVITLVGSLGTSFATMGATLGTVLPELFVLAGVLAVLYKMQSDNASFEAGLAADVAAAGEPTMNPGAQPTPAPSSPYVPGSLGPYKQGTGPYANGDAMAAFTQASQQMKEFFGTMDAEVKSGLANQNALTDSVAAMNKQLADQQAAAAAAAKLNTFRDSVKSLAEAMIQATDSFANFTGAFDKVERDPISGDRLARRMQGQLKAMQDWQAAMQAIKGKVSDQLYQYLLQLGPSAVDEVVALSKNPDALASYAASWQQKYAIAGTMGAQAAKYNYSIGTKIDKQVNTITVVSNDPNKAADAVIARLKALRIIG